LTIETIATNNETYLSKIITIVEQAQQSEPQIQHKVDKIMAVFIPVVLCISVVAAVIWLCVGFLERTSLPMSEVIRYAIQSFIGVLVIACPCGLGLATPMAVITGMGHAAKNGILIKNADCLVRLREVKCIAFDKTGTITEGKPTLTDIVDTSSAVGAGQGGGENRGVVQILVSLEATSIHPIADAILRYAKEKSIQPLPVQSAKSYVGKGIS
jgi:P-type E1-E2 ATPase